MWKTILLLFCFSSAVSQNALFLYHKAVSCQKLLKYDSALYYFNRSLEIIEDTVVMLQKSRCVALTANYNEAILPALKVAEAGNNWGWLYAARYASFAKQTDSSFNYLENYLKFKDRLPDNVIRTDTSFKNINSSYRWEKMWKDLKHDDWTDFKADVYYRLQRNEYTVLFDILDQGLEKYSDKDEFFYYRYLTFSATKNYKGALKNIKRAIKLNPQHSVYYLSFARSMVMQKAYKEAVKNYEKYLKMYPYDINIYPEFVTNCINSAQYDKSIENATYYLQFFEKDVNVLFDLAIATEKKKEYKKAIDLYTSVLNIDGRFFDAYFRRGMCYYEMSDWDNAFNEFTLTLDLKPRSGEVFYYRGIARLNKGDKVGACRDFERAKSYNYLQATEYMMKICKGL